MDYGPEILPALPKGRVRSATLQSAFVRDVDVDFYTELFDAKADITKLNEKSENLAYQPLVDWLSDAARKVEINYSGVIDAATGDVEDAPALQPVSMVVDYDAIVGLHHAIAQTQDLIQKASDDDLAIYEKHVKALCDLFFVETIQVTQSQAAYNRANYPPQ